jgi:prepilin-type N-terminal cleavage/methylation domain-containing protein
MRNVTSSQGMKAERQEGMKGTSESEHSMPSCLNASMPWPMPSPVPANRGLTLIELIAVIVILVVLAGAAVPAMTSFGQTRAATAAQHLTSDINHARQIAVTTGRTAWIVCEPSEHRWSLLIESLASPGRANATVHTDAATGRPYVIDVNVAPFHGVELLSCDFDGELHVGFDWRGRPLTDDETPLTATGASELTGGYRVEVEPETGFVTYVRP